MSRPVHVVAACLAAVLTAATVAGFGGVLEAGADDEAVAVAVVDTAAQAPVAPDAITQDGPAAGAEQAAPVPPWAVPRPPAPLPASTLAEIRDRPDLLADRRLPTVDLLPPPADGRFAATVEPVTPQIRERMGEAWSEVCPVGLHDLRYLTLSFRGFDGEAHTGELVVHHTVAPTMVEVFRRLFEADFPIEEMRLITTADHHAPLTGDANNTAGYNCRRARGQGRWSAHAYGLSVDINPFHNPMVRRGTVIPELGAAYVDRAHVRPGMLTEDGPAVQAFLEAGWQWGGHWVHSKDYMHFSPDGS